MNVRRADSGFVGCCLSMFLRVKSWQEHCLKKKSVYCGSDRPLAGQQERLE